ncbi:MAG: hypothetical protein ACRC33_30465, partial [Gemmataceae bacterium]
MDANQRYRYGWMGLGAMVCLFAVVLACKVRDGNKAHAQPPSDGPVLPEPMVAEKPAPPAALPSLPDSPSVPLPPPGDATPPPPLAGLPLPEIRQELKPVAAEVPALPGPPPPTGSETRPIMIPGVSLPDPVLPPPVAPAVPDPAPLSAVVPPVEAPKPPSALPPAPTPAPVPPAGFVPDAPRSMSAPVTPVSVIVYKVKAPGLTFRTLARWSLGTAERWADIARLNPAYGAEAVFTVGTALTLPGDARVNEIDEGLTPLPSLRARPAPRPRAALPLTGTFPVGMDGRTVTLPAAVLEQLGKCDTVLASPGSSRCLWVTNQAHFERLGAKLDKSPAKEADVQAFKRLYYAQITKLPVRDGKFTLTE